ncbi:TolC family protein [Candidatus Deferrimicrobium sp.]|uniref:TolC family protein n=1 Tax=Candidatus Deferrimicrobium sp. TaxID=3060586 RepID=UPI003C68936F
MTSRALIRIAVPLLALAAIGASARAADNAAVPPARSPEGSVTWSLADVTSMALKNHPLILQSDADVAAAVARKGQARSAWYPSVNLSTGYSRVRSLNTSTNENLTTPNEFARGDLDWMLYDFGRTGASVDRADANAAVSRENAATTREDVAFVATVAFYNVMRAEKTVEFQRENLRQQEALYRQASAFYEAGVRAKIDVVRAEANLYDARAQLSQAENGLRVARITLLQRIGVDGPADFRLSGDLPEFSLPGTLQDWVAEAERNRPELRALVEKERAATESLRLARAGYLPFLVGSAGYGYGAEEVPLQQNYELAVTLNYPLFSGFQTREQTKEALATISSTQYEFIETKRRVRLEVEVSAFGVQEAQERLSARKKQRDASEENLRLATARYEVGAGDIIEMTDAQAQMVRSETDTINTAFDFAVSHASLLRAMGR